MTDHATAPLPHLKPVLHEGTRKLEMESSRRSMEDFLYTSGLGELIAGSVAGMASKLVEFPFDTIKVRLQSQSLTGEKVFHGTWHCLRTTVQYEGFAGLYKGLSTPMFGAMVENAFLFFCYKHIQGSVRRITNTPEEAPLSISALVVSGALSGSCVSFLLTPIELVKCRLQVQHGLTKARYSGPLDCMQSILRRDGIAGFYRGHMGCFLRETAGGAAWFGTYEMITRSLIKPGQTKEDLSPLSLIFAGAAAGIAYNSALYPADVIKSQAQTDESQGPRQGFTQMLRKLYVAEGIAGLYRGFGITLCRAAPSNAIIFLTYEVVNKALTGGRHNNQSSSSS